MIYPCPQCAEPTEDDDFEEGVCPDCCEWNQWRLDYWNAEYDRWSSLSDREREHEIKTAIRRSS